MWWPWLTVLQRRVPYFKLYRSIGDFKSFIQNLYTLVRRLFRWCFCSVSSSSSSLSFFLFCWCLGLASLQSFHQAILFLSLYIQQKQTRFSTRTSNKTWMPTQLMSLTPLGSYFKHLIQRMAVNHRNKSDIDCIQDQPYKTLYYLICFWLNHQTWAFRKTSKARMGRTCCWCCWSSSASFPASAPPGCENPSLSFGWKSAIGATIIYYLHIHSH